MEVMSYSRFAIYYVPPAGPLADLGASWLGWDVVRGCEATQLNIAGLCDITMTPRKYGFHGTLKPPFRLRSDRTIAELKQFTLNLAERVEPAVCKGLYLKTMGRFLALAPQGETSALQRVAAACVRDLDMFRAPADAAELARRRKARLSNRQEELLVQWGYPFVMEEFKFHLTLSGPLPAADIAKWSDTIQRLLPDLNEPFIVDQIALCGQREDGRFELLHRYTLAG